LITHQIATMYLDGQGLTHLKVLKLSLRGKISKQPCFSKINEEHAKRGIHVAKINVWLLWR